MKILQIHKFYSKQLCGGSITAFFDTIKLLEERGHKVVVFSMENELNSHSKYEKYFPSNFDFNNKYNFFQKIRFGVKSLYNFEAQKRLEKLIQKEKPEIAHLHNIYHYLTPSIIHTLKKHNIPIVSTLHAYKEICPNRKLFRQGKICERCKGGKYYNCLFNKCLKNSYPVSFLAMIEAYLHKILRSYEKVNLFLAPSKFIKDKFVEFGVTEKKIKILRNFTNLKTVTKSVGQDLLERNYFLYFGRLVEEKGVDQLILAVEELSKQGKLQNNKLLVMGQGPKEKELKKMVENNNLTKKVIFLGFKQGRELEKIVQKAKFIVLPSIWYENAPLTISEAQFLKKPVIVSDWGGIKEMLIEGKTGLIFRGGNINDLSNKINRMLNFSQDKRKQMGQEGENNSLKLNSKEKHYQQLMASYQGLVKK